MTHIESKEVERSKALIIVEIIEYVPNSVVSKTIIKKSTGNISIMSFDSGEGLTEKISPFDTFAQIIEGQAEIVIDGKSNVLVSGQGIVIPAHLSNIIKANGRFKMISTIIKSGYEIGKIHTPTIMYILKGPTFIPKKTPTKNYTYAGMSMAFITAVRF
jgi:quercetin dioxygenase-like cupin family protein